MPEARMLYHKDEPTPVDLLDRMQYADSFAQFCTLCDTPVTVGLYSAWGGGKTSLMLQIKEHLEKTDGTAFHIIWFNAWEHQFVENPILALSHTIAADLAEKYQSEIRKLLTLVAVALGAQVLKLSSGLSISDLLQHGKRYEEEHFLNRDVSVKLKQHLVALIKKVQKVTNKEKIVFFIDDLDRCSAEQSLKLLEAFKLYLNIEGCIFFLGVDKEALQNIIQTKYAGLPMKEIHYLDKIIQFPFTIPIIEPTTLKKFVATLLPEKLETCQEILEKGLGGNPRQVKRFINNLLFSNGLAEKNIKDYRCTILCSVLLLQERKPDLYRLISRDPSVLLTMREDTEEAKNLKTDYLGDDFDLEDILKDHLFPNAETVAYYIYLTDASGVHTGNSYEEDSVIKKQASVDESELTVFYNENDLNTIFRERGEEVIETLLLFRTARQRTWLLTTPGYIYCILDDEKTRLKNSAIQWKQSTTQNMPVQTRESARKNAVIDIGDKTNWLYSRRLFPDGAALEKKVRSMIENAANEDKVK